MEEYTKMDAINTIYLYIFLSVFCLFIGLILSGNIIIRFTKYFNKKISNEQSYIRIYKLIYTCTGIYFGIISYVLFKINDYRIILISILPIFIFIGLQIWNNKKHLTN
ncbi:MAG: hypothetical protein K0R06_2670 [Clostridium sp.]|jgi:hypothetical protein|nr:hypothetical protein [Clostridium sp.]